MADLMPAAVAVSTNAREVGQAIANAARQVRPNVYGVTAGFTDRLQQAVKHRASSAWHAPGLPHIGNYSGEGPNVATTKYIGTINKEIVLAGTLIIGAVGTDDPRGRRLENGFHGSDSRGRHYDVGPLPHFGPALDDLAIPFAEAIGKAILPDVTGAAK